VRASQREHSDYLLYITLFVAFPLPSILAFVWVLFKKLTDFHEVAFKIIMAGASAVACYYFFRNPLALVSLSVVPVVRLVLQGGSISSLVEKALPDALLASAPLWWAFHIIFSKWNSSLAVPKPTSRSVKNFKTSPEMFETGDDISKGVYLGLIDGRKGHRFYLDPDELNKHTALVGTTGSGKTTTIFSFVRYAMMARQAIIVIDGKGDNALKKRVQAMALELNRPFSLFSTHDAASLGYNPLQIGNVTELTDKIMSLTDWSEDHTNSMPSGSSSFCSRLFASKASSRI
jgi:hypothetical protein